MATKLQKGLQISDEEMRSRCAETTVIDADKKKRKVLE
jgi:hypothetical protein